MSCNWDVEELKAAAQKVPESDIFKSNLRGFSGPELPVSLKL